MKDLYSIWLTLETYKKNNLVIPEQDWPHEVRIALSYLNRKLFEPDCTLQNLQYQFGIHENRLFSQFEHYTGISVADYMQIHRLYAAIQLFKMDATRAMTVDQVGRLIGYHKPGEFQSEFKNVFGVPPFRYRIHRIGKRSITEKPLTDGS